ncbi:MAG: DUF4271 domain-containing protein [Duncaniella sp.]|nr:DUF4271 domain-containing protein [Duncaniella sp.]
MTPTHSQLPEALPTPAVWHPLDISTPQQAPITRAELSTMRQAPIPWLDGLAPEARPSLPGYDSGVLCLLIGMFLVLAVNFRHYSTFFNSFLADLFSIRRREKNFSVRTFSETGVLGSVILVLCLSQGIIINSLLPALPPVPYFSHEFLLIGLLTLGSLFYYFWQLAAYSTVGAVFTDRVSARLWIKGFNASQSLLAMLIVIPAVLVLFNPSISTGVVIMGGVSYLIARVIFICKGFRLFYDNSASLVYFILYLCSLEIVPPVLLYRLVSLLPSA